ncbi:DEAD/DEAH box helicase [Actinomycetospora cinnamomea]|uniref:SNF2 family DNA or RNA helicase n=1 Tax=Actinomycetospora cinnamomea TaxID=663609 RepID=A0A2U1FHX7_9PSEU|nr:DEAD/DEAH box helicase [Actinomycetospora cinnamomea]PVZ11784.1 SNF2 family DNA or RNA helicase [Actinomycetospora cinnamomea]
MLALHALWSPGRGVCLWAENPDLPVRSTSRARRGARPHPFAVPAERLAAAWGLAPGTPTGIAVLALPSDPDGPRDSEALVRDESWPEGDDPVLADWSVPVLELAPGAPPPAPPARTRASASVDHLRAVDALAADLVTRGRLLPAPADDGDLRGLTWRPVLQGPDLVAADTLAAALPPVCRCERVPGEDTPAATAVVEAALAAAVDAHARARLTGSPELAAAPDWAHALGDEPVLGPASPPDALVAGLRRWAVVGAPHAGPARASFRLDEVVVDGFLHALDDPEPVFRLTFALQSAQDPSLTVDAEAVWRDPTALRRWLDDPAELLLGELGRAARIYPEIGDALRVPRPTGLDLDLAGAHHFLAHVAGDLDRAGFGVLLPAGWRAGPARLGLAGAGHAEGPEGVVATGARIGKDDLVDFSWRLTVEGEPLSDAEMDALVRAKAPLVRLRGRWVAVDPERLRDGLAFLAERGAGSDHPSVGDVLHLAVTHPDDVPAPLPVDSLRLDGPLGDLLAGGAALEPLDTPPGVHATLRPYQRRGLSWLAFLARLGLGGVLADDMGLGKTLQVLALEAHERADGSPGPTLLVCPTSVVSTWRREAERFVPHLRVAVHHGAGRGDPGAAAGREFDGADLVVTSYGTLVRDSDALSGLAWHRVVLDEAQMVKNNRSRGAKAVRRLDAGHRLALTGTPVENRLAELWSIMDAVNPGLLGSVSTFRERYAVPVERHGRTDVADDLRRRTRPFLLRRLKTDPTVVDDLPEKIETVERCGLTTEQASLYRVVVDQVLEKIDDVQPGIERRGRVLAAMTKLKQVCDHPALLLHDGSPVGRRSGKIARLEEILAEVLAAGERALLFTQFAAFGDMLAPHLAARFDTEVAWLHGGVSRRARDTMVERFQRGGQEGSGGGPPLFVLSLRAGGTGLTLTAAQHVVHLDRWWNPAVEDQATDRAFRIGQRRTVGVRKLVCAGTLEERIDDLIAGKRALADLAVRDGEDWLGDLSTDELARVLSLDSEPDEADEDPEEADDDGA